MNNSAVLKESTEKGERADIVESIEGDERAGRTESTDHLERHGGARDNQIPGLCLSKRKSQRRNREFQFVL
jgi:hypothetical protein